MPLYEYECAGCGQTSEFLITGSRKPTLECRHCGGKDLKKVLSAHSSYSGSSATSLPGAGDTGCCGMSPGEASCAGPGSCCGKARG